jgi:hypothetical protein
MVGKPIGAIPYLPIKRVPKSPVLNFTAVHFSTFPNRDFRGIFEKNLGSGR